MPRTLDFGHNDLEMHMISRWPCHPSLRVGTQVAFKHGLQRSELFQPWRTRQIVPVYWVRDTTLTNEYK
jgi:hypothetical protein